MISLVVKTKDISSKIIIWCLRVLVYVTLTLLLYSKTTTTSLCPPATNIYTTGSGDTTGLWSVVTGSETFTSSNTRGKTISSMGFGYNQYFFNTTGTDETLIIFNYKASVRMDTTVCLSIFSYPLQGSHSNLLTGSNGTWTCIYNCRGITFTSPKAYNSVVKRTGSRKHMMF